MALGNILSLIVLLVVVGVICAVGFVAYQIANDVKANTKKKMEKKNISFSKEGVKVGVKERSQEEQGDSAQNLLVNIWNNSYFPNYKSKLGWMGDGQNSNPGSPAATPGVDKRKPYSRSSSSQNNMSRTTSAQTPR